MATKAALAIRIQNAVTRLDNSLDSVARVTGVGMGSVPTSHRQAEILHVQQVEALADHVEALAELVVNLTKVNNQQSDEIDSLNKQIEDLTADDETDETGADDQPETPADEPETKKKTGKKAKE